MEYSLIIEKGQHSDPQYINGLKTWERVTNILRNDLDQWAVRVYIYKWSSDHKCLGEKCVTMGNICKVAYSLRDKQVLT